MATKTLEIPSNINPEKMSLLVQALHFFEELISTISKPEGRTNGGNSLLQIDRQGISPLYEGENATLQKLNDVLQSLKSDTSNNPLLPPRELCPENPTTASENPWTLKFLFNIFERLWPKWTKNITQILQICQQYQCGCQSFPEVPQEYEAIANSVQQDTSTNTMPLNRGNNIDTRAIQDRLSLLLQSLQDHGKNDTSITIKDLVPNIISNLLWFIRTYEMANLQQT